MTKKWMAINLLLLAVAGLLGWRLRVSILRFDSRNDPAKILPVRDTRQTIAQEKPLPQWVPPRSYVPADFAVIADKNIFSESRSREDKNEAALQPDTPPLAQKPILVGVNIADTRQDALIIDPAGSSQDRSRHAHSKRVGDVYYGYAITSISPDRIILESGTRKEIIPLHEGAKRASPGKTSILSTRVVPLGGGAASGGAPVSAGASRAAAAPAAAPAAATAQPASSPAPAGQKVVPAASQPTAQPVAPQGQGTHVVRTPFGDVVRPGTN
jgi:hypothetical protein